MIKHLISLAFLVATAAAYGAETKTHYSLIPVYGSVANERDELVVFYENPCGGEVLGVVARSPRPKELLVGLLIESRHETCTGLGQPAAMAVPGVSARSYKNVQSFDANDFQVRPKIAPAQEVRLLDGYGDDKTLSLAYESRCGRPLGVLLSAVGERIAAAFVETGNDSECRRRQYVTDLPGMRKLPLSAVEPFVATAPSLEEAYYLRLSAIKDSSITVHNGKLQVQYVRGCQEAPVGLVSQQLPNGTTAIGLLVAHYLNAPCPEKSPRRFLARYEIPANFLTGHDKILTMAPTHDMWALNLRSPARLTTIKRRGAVSYEVGYYDSCAERIGTVHAPLPNGKLGIAVLERDYDEPCKKPLKEVSFSHQIPSTEAPSTLWQPLWVKGASAM